MDKRIQAIAIGASAGGVAALSVLLPALPVHLQAAVFIVLHLPREQPSLLASLFDAQCALPVREAIDKEPVQSGTVYFAAPDYHLLIDHGSEGAWLALSRDELVNHSRPAIDVLFESAADVYGPHLLGILLTGANRDGAAGLQAVQQAGGLTMVQRPETAHSAVMPAAALRQMCPDHVLSLSEIADFLGPAII